MVDASYQGPERRKQQRRKIADRRQEIRFDSINDDRRRSIGRRATDIVDSE